MLIRQEQIDNASSGSYDWLFATPSPGLKEWILNGKEIFWIKGKPGSGKSTAMKYLAENTRIRDILRGNKDIEWRIIGLFFYDRGKEIHRSLEGVLQLLLYQLVITSDAFLSIAVEVAAEGIGLGNVDPEYFKPTITWTPEKIRKALLTIVRCRVSPRLRTCIFVDALDEHDGDHREVATVFQRLIDAAAEVGNDVKVCISSRPLSSIKDIFDRNPGFQIDEWTMNDILEYVKVNLRGSPRFNSMISDPTTEPHAAKLVHDICQKAEGVFLWVRLVVRDLLESLSDGVGIKDLKAELQRLPNELEAYFLYILQKIADRNRLEAYLMFNCLVSARDPLTVKELQVMIYIARAGLHSRNTSSSYKMFLRGLRSAISVEDGQDMERRIRSCGGQLLEIRESPAVPATFAEEAQNAAMPMSTPLIVQTMHKTVKEFLHSESNRESVLITRDGSSSIQKPQGNGYVYILEYCLWLALSSDFGFHGAFSTDSIATQIMDAALHLDRSSFPHYVDLLNYLDESMVRSHPRKLEWPTQPDMYEAELLHGVTWLEQATITGMSRYLGNKLETDPKIVERDGRPPLLHCAVWDTIRLDLLGLFLKNGADVNRLYNGRSAISWVFLKPDSTRPYLADAIELLLTHGADPRKEVLLLATSSDGGPVLDTQPLLHGIVRLHLDLTDTKRLLALALARGADIRVEDKGGCGVFDIINSSTPGQHDLLYWLLQKKASFSSRIQYTLQHAVDGAPALATMMVRLFQVA